MVTSLVIRKAWAPLLAYVLPLSVFAYPFCYNLVTRPESVHLIAPRSPVLVRLLGIVLGVGFSWLTARMVWSLGFQPKAVVLSEVGILNYVDWTIRSTASRFASWDEIVRVELRRGRFLWRDGRLLILHVARGRPMRVPRGWFTRSDWKVVRAEVMARAGAASR